MDPVPLRTLLGQEFDPSLENSINCSLKQARTQREGGLQGRSNPKSEFKKKINCIEDT